jgi:hypothetical protein
MDVPCSGVCNQRVFSSCAAARRVGPKSISTGLPSDGGWGRDHRDTSYCSPERPCVHGCREFPAQERCDEIAASCIVGIDAIAFKPSAEATDEQEPSLC